ncbi:MAG TPA: pyridoxamine 5'-phosphate oxidase [Candidatus Binataceae bacterium]|nr:pyridoxamine 5'-phosphate oxidase [Candidatus Binataceae bacterium]
MARSSQKAENHTARASIDPIARFHTWFAQARRAKAPLTEAMALATASHDGHVSVRFVLLKQVDDRGFVFYTDRRSAKGRNLQDNPRASLALYWDATGKQVRVEGAIEEVSAAEADAYWASRPRQSRLSGSVSRQSAKLGSRTELVDAVNRLRMSLKGSDVRRPDYWTGFRVIPDSIEFWTRRSHRLHERERYERIAKGWKLTLLQP